MPPADPYRDKPLAVRLCAELARLAMIEEFAHPVDPFSKDTVLCGRAISVAEDLEGMIIQDLKITEPIKDDPYARHRLAMDPEDIEAHLPADLTLTSEAFENCLACCLALLIDQNGCLPSSRKPFVPPLAYHRLMQLMLEAGYVERQAGSAVLWTDSLVPTMRRCSIWTEDLECRVEAEDAAFAEHVEHALRTMPEFVRRKLVSAKLAAQTQGTKVFHSAIETYWDGEAWVPPRSEEERNRWWDASRTWKFADAIRTRL